MADALCGPSNALQNFQKHTSVDRSLQHDRLASRHSPSQGFRSSPGPAASHLDAEFQAFQAPSPLSGAQPPLSQAPLHQAPLPHFARAPIAPQLPSWASDFQQLNISQSRASPLSSAKFRHDSPVQRNIPSTGWHQEFMQHNHQPLAQNVPMSNGYMGPSFQGHMNQFSPMNYSTQYESSLQSQGQANHPLQSDDQFDEAAFARAFDAAQEEAEQAASKGKERAQESEPLTFDMSHACTDPGDITGSFDFAAFEEHTVNTSLASRHGFLQAEKDTLTTELRTMKSDGGWDALEAFERAHEYEMSQTGSLRSRYIVDEIRNMREEEQRVRDDQQRLGSAPTEEMVKIGADTIAAENQQEKLSPEAEADELSKTAGHLLNNLRDEQSEKFQQSSFMELMRQLRDREVRVEGDKMVPQAPHPGGKFYPYDAFADSHPGTSVPPSDTLPDNGVTQVGA